MEIPGVHRAGLGVLPPGTYTFSILDAQTDRHICQISNAAGTEVLATILAMPNYRLRATDRAILVFADALSGQREALLAWFYPGPNWGEEVVYDKAKAAELARVTKRLVLFTSMDLARSSDPTAPALVHQMRRAYIGAVKPSGEEVDATQSVTTPPARSELAPWSPILPPAPAAANVQAAPEPAVPPDPIPLQVIAVVGGVVLVALLLPALVIIRLA